MNPRYILAVPVVAAAGFLAGWYMALSVIAEHIIGGDE